MGICFIPRQHSLVSPDIQGDAFGPTFRRKSELVKILMSWLWIHGLDDELLGLVDKSLGSDDKSLGSDDTILGSDDKLLSLKD